MFREIQKYEPCPVGVGFDSHPVVNEQTGVVERVKRSCAAPLPDPRLFDATACVKAGVNLEQVRSRVMGVLPESFNPVKVPENEEEKPAFPPAGA